MIAIDIPGWKELELEHLVLDFNGTMACDGKLVSGVRERLDRLAADLRILVLTADTFGTARQELEGLPLELTVLPTANQAEAKRHRIERLGAAATVAIGNGRNDRLMLEEAALGVAVLQEEGAAMETLALADVVSQDIRDALDLLLHPARLRATLRS